MDKSSSHSAITEQALAKLHAQLHQSAHDTLTYLDALKHNLGGYDKKHHLHHSNSATSFFSDGLDHAKDAVKELKHVADHIHKEVSAVGVEAARRAMEQTFNALADVHKVANAFDAFNIEHKSYSDKEKVTTSETMEWLVSTTRDATFTGFAALHKQIMEIKTGTNERDKHSIKARAKEAIHKIENAVRPEHKPSS